MGSLICYAGFPVDGERAAKIRSEVGKRLYAAEASLPTSALGRAARTVVSVGRGSAIAIGRGLLRGSREATADVDAVAEFVASIGELKGITMKMGQLLGYIDVGLHEDLRVGLSMLQTHAQPMPFDRVRELVETELGDAGRELLRAMVPQPISAASMGQVHTSALPDGTRVAVKVVYPGIADTVAQDFGPASLGGLLASWIYPRANLDAFVREVRARVLEECDYALEANRQERFRELFAGHSTIVIPAVHRMYSSARVLTTTFVEGRDLESWLATNPDAAARARAGEAIFDFYLGSLFRHGLYNSDPHPGNYIFMPDGKTAFIDFGSTREFEPGFVGRLAALTDAVRADDEERMHRALLHLGIVQPDKPYHHYSTRWLVRAFYGPMLQDAVVPFDLGVGLTLREILRRQQRARGLALPGELLFLLRTSLGLAAVLTRLDARANWYRLMQGLLDVAPPSPDPEPVKIEPKPAPRTLDLDAYRAAPRAQEAKKLEKPEKPEKVDEDRSGSFDVVLIDPGDGIIEVLRQIRHATGMGLREAKDLIDARPKAIGNPLPKAQAELLQRRLETVGAKVELRPAGA